MISGPGSRLGPYEILAPLGSGGMGEVFRALDTRLDRTVAIKVLSRSALEGRDPDLELFFDSPSVSRQHAVITVAGDEATIEDLGSRNGTFVRATRIDTPMRLGDGDTIRIGSVTLTIRAVRSPGSTETASIDDG
jgi:pSer/pThr/pTyr-binding forkhead associated (FHA) protein